MRFRCYDNDALEYWAVLSLANFRGAGDSELMTLGNLDGKYCRSKPKELLTSLLGYVAISQPPTKDSIIRGPTIQISATQSTQSLLGELAASTQTQVSAKAASSPDSQRTTTSQRSNLGGKFPRSQSPQAKAAAVIDVEGSDTDESSQDDSDEGDDDESIQCHQPSPVKPKPVKPIPKKRKAPVDGVNPAVGAKQLAQKKLGAGFSANKKAKIAPSKTASADKAADNSIAFSGANMNLEMITKFLEQKLFADAKTREIEESKKPGKAKGLGKGGKARDAVPKAVAGCATTEQKGTQLFMNDTHCFCSSNDRRLRCLECARP